MPLYRPLAKISAGPSGILALRLCISMIPALYFSRSLFSRSLFPPAPYFVSGALQRGSRYKGLGTLGNLDSRSHFHQDSCNLYFPATYFLPATYSYFSRPSVSGEGWASGLAQPPPIRDLVTYWALSCFLPVNLPLPGIPIPPLIYFRYLFHSVTYFRERPVVISLVKS